MRQSQEALVVESDLRALAVALWTWCSSVSSRQSARQLDAMHAKLVHLTSRDECNSLTTGAIVQSLHSQVLGTVIFLNWYMLVHQAKQSERRAELRSKLKIKAMQQIEIALTSTQRSASLLVAWLAWREYLLKSSAQATHDYVSQKASTQLVAATSRARERAFGVLWLSSWWQAAQVCKERQARAHHASLSRHQIYGFAGKMLSQNQQWSVQALLVQWRVAVLVSNQAHLANAQLRPADSNSKWGSSITLPREALGKVLSRWEDRDRVMCIAHAFDTWLQSSCAHQENLAMRRLALVAISRHESGAVCRMCFHQWWSMTRQDRNIAAVVEDERLQWQEHMLDQHTQQCLALQLLERKHSRWGGASEILSRRMLGEKLVMLVAVVFSDWLRLRDQGIDGRRRRGALAAAFGRFCLGRTVAVAQTCLLSWRQWAIAEAALRLSEAERAEAQQLIDESNGWLLNLQQERSELREHLRLADERAEALSEKLRREFKTKEALAAELREAYGQLRGGLRLSSSAGALAGGAAPLAVAAVAWSSALPLPPTTTTTVAEEPAYLERDGSVVRQKLLGQFDAMLELSSRSAGRGHSNSLMGRAERLGLFSEGSAEWAPTTMTLNGRATTPTQQGFRNARMAASPLSRLLPQVLESALVPEAKTLREGDIAASALRPGTPSAAATLAPWPCSDGRDHGPGTAGTGPRSAPRSSSQPARCSWDSTVDALHDTLKLGHRS